MIAPHLDERSETILLKIIEEYIENAGPVGSRSLSKKHKEALSPATIRNVMADLEDMGYLQQPHTSAGRIPTDKGYRYFVDKLLQPQSFLAEVKTLTHGFDPSHRSNLQKVLEDACGVLSQNTHQAGLVMLPSFSNMLFKHIEFVKVGKNEALAVFFSEMGVLQNKVVQVEPETSQEELTSISNYLNDEFSGKSICWIREELLHRLKNENEHYNQLMKKAMRLSSNLLFDNNDDSSLLVDGALNFFDQPEFTADVKQIQTLLTTLEEKTKLIKLLDLCLQQDGTTVLIGQENPDEEMSNCSLIARNYQWGEKDIGTLAIFGPKRMDYKKAITIVNRTAKTVSNLLSE